MPPILGPPAPSFPSIANRRGTTEEGVRQFLATTHSTVRSLNSMPNPALTDDQIRQAAAFLLSLKNSLVPFRLGEFPASPAKPIDTSQPMNR